MGGFSWSTCKKPFYSIKIIEKYAASGVITAVKSLQYWPRLMKYQKRFSLKNYHYERFYGTGSGLPRIAPTIN